MFHSLIPLSASFSTFVDCFDNSHHPVAELWTGAGLEPSTGPTGGSGGPQPAPPPTSSLSLQLGPANEGLLPLGRGREAIKTKTKAVQTQGREGGMSHLSVFLRWGVEKSQDPVMKREDEVNG